MEIPIKMDDLGGTTSFGNTPKYTLNLKWSQKTWEGEKPAKMRMGKSEFQKSSDPKGVLYW